MYARPVVWVHGGPEILCTRCNNPHWDWSFMPGLRCYQCPSHCDVVMCGMCIRGHVYHFAELDLSLKVAGRSCTSVWLFLLIVFCPILFYRMQANIFVRFAGVVCGFCCCGSVCCTGRPVSFGCRRGGRRLWRVGSAVECRPLTALRCGRSRGFSLPRRGEWLGLRRAD